MTNIVISTSTFDVAGNRSLETVTERGVDIVTNPHGRKLTEAEIIDLLDADTIGLIAGVEPLTDAVFASAPGLRVISRCGTGVDNIDKIAAQKHGIRIRRTPDAPSGAVAELTVALMLTALRHLTLVDRRLRDGDWHRPRGRLLNGQRVGIVGMGRIGTRVAELCRAFGASVITTDPLLDWLPEGLELVPLEELLTRASIVSLHAPLSRKTVGIINDDTLSRMRKDAILVNTARAGLVDEAALLQALTQGRIAAAALDVYQQEPYQGPLAGLDNVVLSPHIGSNTAESRQRMEIEAIDNLLDALGWQA